MASLELVMLQNRVNELRMSPLVPSAFKEALGYMLAWCMQADKRLLDLETKLRNRDG